MYKMKLEKKPKTNRRKTNTKYHTSSITPYIHVMKYKNKLGIL